MRDAGTAEAREAPAPHLGLVPAATERVEPRGAIDGLELWEIVAVDTPRLKQVQPAAADGTHWHAAISVDHCRWDPCPKESLRFPRE